MAAAVCPYLIPDTPYCPTQSLIASSRTYQTTCSSVKVPLRAVQVLVHVLLDYAALLRGIVELGQTFVLPLTANSITGQLAVAM